MDVLREREVRKALEVFSFKDLQNCMALLTFIKRKKIDPDEFVSVISRHVAINKRRVKRHNFLVKRYFRESAEKVDFLSKSFGTVFFTESCPECGTNMQLHDSGENDSHWVCPMCRFGKYVPIPAGEELRRRHLGSNKRLRQEKKNGQ